MKKFFLFLTLFSFCFVCYAQIENSREKISLTVKNIQTGEDLSLLTNFFLENSDHIYSYIPSKYSEDYLLFELEVKDSSQDFFQFLTNPQAGFLLDRYSIDDTNNMEVYFQRTDTQSYNYLDFFEGSKFEEAIRFFFDNSTDFEIWKPDMLEVEKNNNFLTNNPADLQQKIFATLNSREDKDIYSLESEELENIDIYIRIFSNTEPILLNIYDEDFSLSKQFLITPEQAIYQFQYTGFYSKSIYLEFLNNNKKKLIAGGKNFNASYIFAIF